MLFLFLFQELPSDLRLLFHWIDLKRQHVSYAPPPPSFLPPRLSPSSSSSSRAQGTSTARSECDDPTSRRGENRDRVFFFERKKGREEEERRGSRERSIPPFSAGLTSPRSFASSSSFPFLLANRDLRRDREFHVEARYSCRSERKMDNIQRNEEEEEEEEESGREGERSLPRSRARFDTRDEDACTSSSSLCSSRFSMEWKDSASYRDRLKAHCDRASIPSSSSFSLHHSFSSSCSSSISLTPYQELQEFGRKLLDSVGFFYTNE